MLDAFDLLFREGRLDVRNLKRDTGKLPSQRRQLLQNLVGNGDFTRGCLFSD